MANRMATLPIAERRLRPIYDSLDNGNNKKALQEAEKVLKKQPDLQCAKVLKCLALLRLGRETEGMEQLDFVKRSCTNEESVLQAMTICYREIHKPDLICEIYENASTKDPKNEDVLTHLFLSYVRVLNYPKQQCTAIALSKLNQKNYYNFWYVISLLLQINNDVIEDLLQYFLPPLAFLDNNREKKVYDSNLNLRLSEKILEKLFPSKLEKDQEILVYVIILEMQGKMAEALKILQSPLGQKIDRNLLEDKIIDLCIRLGQYEEANRLLKSRIIESIDSWNHIVYYFRTLFNLMETQNHNIKVKMLAEAKEFIDSILKKNTESGEIPKRGPYLAYLEFYSLLEDNSIVNPEEILGDVVALFMNYFNVFGSKECCLHDLRPYLKLLDGEHAKEFLMSVCSLTGLTGKEIPSTKQQMDRHISNLCLCRALSFFEVMTYDLLVSVVSNLVEYFIKTQKFCSGLQLTEPRSNDRYCLLAVHMLYQLWNDQKDSNYLYEAIVLCHYALEFSPSNNQFKTLLLKFYHLVGGTTGAHEAFLSLDLKHMQLDTLGYAHAYPLFSSGHFTAAQTVINSSIKFFTNNSKESAEHITYAYKYEAYTKIPEFIEMRERMNNSIYFMTLSVENILLPLFFTPSYPLNSPVSSSVETTLGKINWAKLRDNRDLKVLWEVDPLKCCMTPQTVKQTYNHDFVYLRLRSHLLKIVYKLLQVKDAEPNQILCDSNGYECSAAFSEAKSALSGYSSELETSLKGLKNNRPYPIKKKIISGPPESRLLLFLSCNYFDLVLSEVGMVTQLLPGDMSCKENTQMYLNKIDTYLQDFVTYLHGEKFNTDDLTIKCSFIKNCIAFSELLMFSCIVHSVCESVLKRMKQALFKMHKKKRDLSQKVQETKDDYDWKSMAVSKFSSMVLSSLTELEALLRNEEKCWVEKSKKSEKGSFVFNVSDEEHLSRMLSLSDSVNKCISQSYFTSCSQVLDILKQRIKYLGTPQTTQKV